MRLEAENSFFGASVVKASLMHGLDWISQKGLACKISLMRLDSQVGLQDQLHRLDSQVGLQDQPQRLDSQTGLQDQPQRLDSQIGLFDSHKGLIARLACLTAIYRLGSSSN